MRLILTLLLVVGLASPSFAASLQIFGSGGSGSGTASTLIDDIPCDADEYLRRNGSDDGWTCTTGTATGDSIFIDGSPVSDPDFVDTGDINFTDTADTITATINPDVVGADELADADFGDFTCADGGGGCTLDTDVVAAAEMADADHGDISWSGGVASVDANAVALGTDTTGNYADGDEEGGAATSGDSATDFFTVGQIERARGGLGVDTSSYGNGLIGSNGSNVTIDVDTLTEIETAIGGATNIISSDEIDSLVKLNIFTTDEDIVGLTSAQTLSSGTKTVTSKFDFGGGTLEVPNSDTLPATCTVGEGFMDTDATSGQRWYLCESTNTWALQGGTGGAETNSLETLTTGIADDEIPIGSGADDVVYTAIGDCNAAGEALQYDTATNAFSCLSGLGAGGTVDDIAGDTGTTTGANITIAGGTNVTTAVSGDTLTVNVDAASTFATSVTTPVLTLSGTGTINGLDAIDSTTENYLESELDTLNNVTSATSLVSVGTITTGAWNAGAVTSSGTVTGTDLTLTGDATGTLSGVDAVDATTEDSIEATIFDSDAQTVTGIWTYSAAPVFQDDVNIAIGTSSEWLVEYDDATDDQLLIRSAKTATIAPTDPMVEILVDTGAAGMTADQQVFGIAKGSQASNTPLLTIDEDGDFVVAATITASGTITAPTITTSDVTAEPGNLLSINDNDTAFTLDPTCANSGSEGTLTIIDKDETSDDSWVVCDGENELFDFTAGAGDITAVGDCANSAAFGGACGTTLTSTTGETINLGTADTFIFARNDSGTVTFTGADNSGAANTIYDTASNGTIQIGSGDVASITFSGATNEDLTWTFGTNSVALSSSTGVATINHPDGSIPFVDLAAPTTVDWGGITSFEIPNAAAPTTNAAGQIALDTTITDHQPLIQYYDGGENMTVIAVDTAELPATDGEIVKYDATTDKFIFAADNTGGAGVWTDADPVLLSTTTRDVVVGAAAINSSKLSVDGDADQVQFSVQGHSSQTDSLIIGESSAGTEIFNVDVDGTVKAQSITDIDGPGTSWSISSLGLGTFSVGVTIGATTSLTLGNQGVSITDDNDGAITFLGLGNGSDEAFTLNLDDTSNEITITSGTGVTTFNFPNASIPLADLQTLGTGVATALGLNVGSAGAPVVFNGDAGTPSAIVLTNATGTAASLTAGDVDDNSITNGDLATTDGECFPLYAPDTEIADTDDIQSVWRNSTGSTIVITEVWCETDTGTVTMDLQIDDGTPADVMGADLACDASGETDNTSLTGSMAAGDRLDFAITSVATNPTRLTVCIAYSR